MTRTIWLIAVRNLVRDPRRIMGIIAFVCICLFLLTTGNALLEGTQQGIQTAFAKSFTADVIVFPKESSNLSLFGDQTPIVGGYMAIPALGKPAEIEALVRSRPEVQETSFQISSHVLIQCGEKSVGTDVFGVEFPRYAAAMPGIALKSGAFPAQGKEGILLGKKTSQNLEQLLGRPLVLGEPISVLVSRNERFDIRSVPFSGILGYEVQNDILDSINLIDIATMSELSALDAPLAASPETESSADLGNIFDEAEDTVVGADAPGISLDHVEDAVKTVPVETVGQQTRYGSHFLLIRLKDGSDVSGFMSRLDKDMAEKDLQGVSRDWMGAAGSSASFLSWIRILFNLGMIVVLATGIAIVINTLAISIIERTQEIGTMRAVGASKSLVFKVFLAENMMAVGGAGILGVCLGYGASWLVHAVNIPLDSPALRTLFGSSNLVAALSPGLYLQHGAIALAIALVSSLYPVLAAIKIKPARAMGMN